MDSFELIADNLTFNRKRFGSDINLFKEAAPRKKARFIPPEPKSSNPRSEFRIQVDGENPPDCIGTLASLYSTHPIPDHLQQAINSRYSTLTPIQMQAIPCILQKRDLIGIAPTGSGKTLAFLLPILASLQKGRLQAIIVAPTKELARQLQEEAILLAEGSNFNIVLLSKQSPDIKDLRKTAEIIVSTPLTLLHKLQDRKIKSVKFIVLDEADQLFDMGFVEQIDAIFKQTQRRNQCRMMFSATILPAVEIMARSVLINPLRIIVGNKNATVTTIKQSLKFCTNEGGKLLAIRQMIGDGQFTPPAIIFVQSKVRAKELLHELIHENVRAAAIHADLLPAKREKIIKLFRLGYIWTLICTDVLSRGIDFQDVKLVINYDFPQSIISYIHRVGRTGRMGKHGNVVTLYTLEDAPYLKMIVNLLKRSGAEVPEWMNNLKGPSARQKKELEKKPVRREKIKRGAKLNRTLRTFIKKKRSKSNEG